jgi:hypothetical protein
MRGKASKERLALRKYWRVQKRKQKAKKEKEAKAK